MSHFTRSFSRIIATSTRVSCQRSRGIQTSATTAGGGHYSEITDYNLFLWDRPDGFPEGHVPHKEHAWERRGYISEIEDYWLAILLGLTTALYFGLWHAKRKVDNADEAVKVAEERFANGILIDLFPDQKDGRIYVNNREFFPDHDPHTYDPTAEREYFWIQ